MRREDKTRYTSIIRWEKEGLLRKDIIHNERSIDRYIYGLILVDN